MKAFLSITAILLLASLSAFAQKTNDAIAAQIKSLHAEKTITLTYDDGSKTSKIFARAENFSDADTKRAGVQAMNYGMAFFYVGKTLTAQPEAINLTFIAVSKKPVFAAAHNWTVTLAKGTLDLGDARYAAKAGENAEYLNFKVSPADLVKIAAEPNAKFHLGSFEFSFTPGQFATLKNFLAVSDIH